MPGSTPASNFLNFLVVDNMNMPTLRPQNLERPPATYTILDSGAFSAYTRGDEVNADEFIRFCQRYQRYFFRIVVLDSIPPKSEGQSTKKRKKYDKGTFEYTSAEGAEEGAVRSYEMWVRMRDAGIENVTPVFHRFERFDWLKRYVDEGADYICLGPGAYSTSKKKLDWLDSCFDILTDGDGYPIVDTHGLAVTSVELIMRYPWTSVDSSAWAKKAGFGQVMIPHAKRADGSYDYSRSRIITVSDVAYNLASQQSDAEVKRTFHGMSRPQREYVCEYLEKVCDRQFSQVAVSPKHRRICNIIFFHELSKFHNVKRFERPLELV